jgi:ABC-type antimicrobial peptide transport system permease subunit
MLKNYWTIAIRNLLRSKGFSLLNLVGLSVGMASATLILLWIHNESTYDNFHTNKNQLYQVWNRGIISGELACWNNTPKILAPALRREYPNIANVCRTDNRWFVTDVGEKKMTSHVLIVDSTFLSMFSFPLVQGNAANALKDPYSIVLTQSLAKKLFGDKDPMNQTVKINTSRFAVTGVLKDLPSNTSMDFEFLLPYNYERVIGEDDADSAGSWGNNSVTTWVQLQPNATETATNYQVQKTTIRHSKGIEKTEIFLHPLSKLHLYSEFVNGVNTGGYITTVRLFAIIAAFILLVACINFMNLSTARSERRAKEVGIRKVAGAYRGLLIGQFLGESVLLAFLSAILAALLVQISLPAFNTLVAKQLTVPYDSAWFWGLALLFIGVTGILAGSYPAFFLSGFQPVAVLKGVFRRSHAAINPRKILVVLQFSFAILLIICTFIVVRQIRYAQDRAAGYDRSRIVYHWLTGELNNRYTALKRDLISSGAATDVCRTGSPLTSIISDSWGFQWEGKQTDDHTDFDRYSEDEGLVKTAGLQLVTGRDISLVKYPMDSTAMLLNESAVKAMGFKDPIGQIVRDDPFVFHVVGVIKDFAMRGPYDKPHPMVIEGAKINFFNVVNIRLAEGRRTAQNIDNIRQIFMRYNPDFPFEYHFTDDDFGQKFADTQRIATLTGLFAGLTIFISCLGLFGLAAYMAESRIKEIGVRKVLGASVLSITALLTKDFLTLVVLAILIASPLAWYIMDGWLEDYSYRVSIDPWVFLIAGAVSIGIALLTVGGQAIAAARTNPAKNLRPE